MTVTLTRILIEMAGGIKKNKEKLCLTKSSTKILEVKHTGRFWTGR